MDIRKYIGIKCTEKKKEINMDNFRQYHLGKEFYRILNSEEKITVYYITSLEMHYSREYFKAEISTELGGVGGCIIKIFPDGKIEQEENTIPIYTNINDALNALDEKLELKRKELRIKELYLETLKAELEYSKAKVQQTSSIKL